MAKTPESTENLPGRFQLLSDDSALITGAGTNIGMTTARLFAREGVRLVLSDINEERGKQLTAELVAANCVATFVRADLSDPAEAVRLAHAAIQQLGRVSLFVHSASPLRAETDTLFAVTDATFYEMFNVNAMAAFILGRDLGRHMSELGVHGRMVFVTSLHASETRYLPHYSSSKAAEAMIMKELARALGPFGIRVNAVAPGAVKGGTVKLSDDKEAMWSSKIPMRRTGLQEEVAQMILALVVDRFSSYVTGTTVAVDGGLDLYNWKHEPG